MVLTLPDPASRTEADGSTFRAKLISLLTPYKVAVEELDVKTREQIAVFGGTGTLTVGAGSARFRFPWAVTILGVSATVGTAPTGASILIDVNKNGTTLFTTQSARPTILASAFVTTTEAVPAITTLIAGDYLTVDRDQIGSTIAGADLSVFIRYKLT